MRTAGVAEFVRIPPQLPFETDSHEFRYVNHPPQYVGSDSIGTTAAVATGEP